MCVINSITYLSPYSENKNDCFEILLDVIPCSFTCYLLDLFNSGKSWNYGNMVACFSSATKRPENKFYEKFKL